MPVRMSLMTPGELSAVMSGAADAASAALPPKTLFVLIAWDPLDVTTGGRGVGQYISNCDRSSIVAALREVADRLEAGRVEERSPFPEGPDPSAN